MILDTRQKFKEFDWEVANQSSKYQKFVSSPRFQPWARGLSRLEVAVQACKLYGWVDGLVVVRELRRLIMSSMDPDFYDERSLPAFLKKTLVPTTATLFGKLGLERREYQLPFFEERIRTWIQTPRIWHTLNGSDPIDSVLEGVEKILLSGKGVIAEPIGFREFIANREWTRSGVTSWKDLVPKGYNSSKTTIALTASTDEILEQLDRRMVVWSNPELYEKEKLGKGYSFTLHAKPEPMKTRAVIADVMDLYIYMSYITYYIYPFIEDNPYLHQAQTSNVKFEFWRRCQQYSEMTWKVDLDYSTWDEGILKEVVLRIVDVLCAKAYEISNMSRDVLIAWRRIRTILNIIGIEVQSPDGPVWVAWLNGLITGFLWTWLINGLVNIAVAMYILSVLGITPLMLVAQGDDIHEIFSAGDYSEEIHQRYLQLNDDFGFTVNQLKSKLTPPGPYGGEFLQMEILPGRILGTKWRLIRALTWGSDEVVEGVTVLVKSIQTKLSARVTIWSTYISRDGDVDPEWIVTDLHNVAKRTISKSVIRAMLRTSVASGGFGLYGNSTELEFIWEGGKPVPYRHRIRLKPVHFKRNKRAWLRGLSTALTSVKKESLPTGEVTLRIEKQTFKLRTWLGAKRTIFATLPDRVPHRFDSIFLFRKDQEQYVFDELLVLEGLRKDETIDDPYLQSRIDQWRSITTTKMWPEVLAAKGLPKVKLTPLVLIKFGEILAPYLTNAIGQRVAAMTMSSKVSKFTYYSSQVITDQTLLNNTILYNWSSPQSWQVLTLPLQGWVYQD